MGDTPYHHAGLKAEMLKKGLQLLNEDGYEAFSLRKLAGMCNVSHTAPYRHFKNKDELIQAMCGQIAADMLSTFGGVLKAYAHDPRARLLELCKAYVRLMVENPDYFRYVFMTMHEKPIVFTGGDFIYGDEGHPFVLMKNFAREYFEKVCGNDWAETYLGIWSQLHGFTLLLVNQTIQYEGDYLAMVENMAIRFIESIEPK